MRSAPTPPSHPIRPPLAALRLGSLILGAALVTSCGGGGEPVATWDAPAPLVVRGASIFDGLSDGRGAPQDVWIDGDRIARITPAGAEPLPAGTVEIDGQGKTLLPGLIDVHVHLGSSAAPPWKLVPGDPERNATKFLWAGVTTVFDLGAKLDTIEALKAKVASGELAGPQIFFAGPHIAIAHGHPQAMLDALAPWPVNRMMRDHLTFAVEDAGDIDDAIASVKAHGGDLIKVTVDEIPLGAPKLGGELLRHAVDGAHQAGFKVAAHIGNQENALAAVDAGVDYLVHGVYRDTLSAVVADHIKEAGVPVAVTIGVFDSVDRLSHEGITLAPLQRELSDPVVLEAIQNPPDSLDIEVMEPWIEANHAHRQARFDNAALMRERGVTVMVGSDSPTLAWEAGSALHRELELLVEAGFPPGEVLRRATAVNAAAMSLTDRGTIEVGKRADLLLVKGDPTADIAAVHAISAVVRGGRRVVRAALP